MDEAKLRRVQGLAWKCNGPQRVRAVDIPALAHERMTAQTGLNADLIPLPCLQLSQFVC